jgi:hypothetical protein
MPKVILAHPDLQECFAAPCDTGSPLGTLQTDFSEHVDFSLLSSSPEGWFCKPSPWNNEEDAPDPTGQDALRERCARFTAWLAARPEERIIIVAHHTLFCWLLNIDFQNCEVMEMTLDEEGASPIWKVVQACGDVVPMYKKDGEPVTWMGSPPLKASLGACLGKHGAEVAQETARRAGLPDPVEVPPPVPASCPGCH